MTDETALEYEAGIIGSILLDESCTPKVLAIATPEDFYYEPYKLIYATICEMYAAGKSIDHITVTAEMAKNGHAEKDMHTLIRDVWNLTPTAAHAEAYANALRGMARMRRIKGLLESALMEHGDPDTITDAVMEGLYAIERGGSKGRAVTLNEALNRFTQWAISEETEKRIDTGFARLDRILHGMYPGNLVLLAARPGVGKSAIAASLALRVAEKGTAAVLFSCEMSNDEIVQRYIANRAGINLDDVTDRTFLDDNGQRDRASKAMEDIRHFPLYLYDDPGISAMDIRRTLQTVRNVGIIVVDYIQLMDAAGKSENRNLEVAGISKALKQIAREFGIPVIALSQLSRTKDDTDEPGLTALRDSGALEQDADKVILLWRVSDEPGELPKIGVKVAKNRMSKTGTVLMRFNGERMSFYETDEEYTTKKRGRGRDFYPVNIRDGDLPFKD